MRRIFAAENDSGEWSVADLVLDYRICTFNTELHGGAHVHHPLDAAAGPSVDVRSAAHRKAVVAEYGRHATAFEPAMFREVVARCRF